MFYNEILLPTKLWGTGFAKGTKVAFPAPGERTVCRRWHVLWEAELQSQAAALAGRGDSRAAGSQGRERAGQ